MLFEINSIKYEMNEILTMIPHPNNQQQPEFLGKIQNSDWNFQLLMLIKIRDSQFQATQKINSSSQS